MSLEKKLEPEDDIRDSQLMSWSKIQTFRPSSQGLTHSEPRYGVLLKDPQVVAIVTDLEGCVV